jgi:transcriptional regulator with XRE-family HTH domain
MEPIEPTPDKPAWTQLGDLIKRERVRMELSHRDVAERCGAGTAQVAAWEAGRAIIDPRSWARLKGSLPILRAAGAVWRAALHERGGACIVDEPPEPPESSAAPPPIMPPDIPDPAKQRSFGAALRVARLNEGLRQEDLGELLGVSASAVGSWELEKSTPVLDNWTR